MINLFTESTTTFLIETAVLPRKFDAVLNRFNDVILKHVSTGYRINLGELGNILIDGNTVTLQDIKVTVYNYSCNCSDPGNPSPFKIFDPTFDPTFQ